MIKFLFCFILAAHTISAYGKIHVKNEWKKNLPQKLSEKIQNILGVMHDMKLCSQQKYIFVYAFEKLYIQVLQLGCFVEPYLKFQRQNSDFDFIFAKIIVYLNKCKNIFPGYTMDLTRLNKSGQESLLRKRYPYFFAIFDLLSNCVRILDTDSALTDEELAKIYAPNVHKNIVLILQRFRIRNAYREICHNLTNATSKYVLYPFKMLQNQQTNDESASAKISPPSVKPKLSKAIVPNYSLLKHFYDKDTNALIKQSAQSQNQNATVVLPFQDQQYLEQSLQSIQHPTNHRLQRFHEEGHASDQKVFNQRPNETPEKSVDLTSLIENPAETVKWFYIISDHLTSGQPLLNLDNIIMTLTQIQANTPDPAIARRAQQLLKKIEKTLIQKHVQVSKIKAIDLIPAA